METTQQKLIVAILEHYFQCHCQRCSDSADADDLHMDSIRCQECRRKNENEDPPSYFPHGKSCPKCGWVENQDVTRQMKSEMNELNLGIPIWKITMVTGTQGKVTLVESHPHPKSLC